MIVKCPTCCTEHTLDRKKQKTAAKIGFWCDGPGYGQRHTIARCKAC